VKKGFAGLLISTVLLSLLYGECDNNAYKLVKSYDSIVGCVENRIILKSGKSFIYDDGIEKSFFELLNSPDIEDMFKFKYPKKWLNSPPPKNYDPGRIRFEPLFKEIYGASRAEVKRNLVAIRWIDGRVILVNRKNGASRALMMVVRDLKRLPNRYKKYLTPIGGTFYWRKIAGTDRLSFHSFGTAIDINVKYSNYWRWSKGRYRYQNKIPKEIVEIFERHGFIWGGKWYHYDTMHFEYRPELLK
jgi:hypothetical protein